MPNWYCHWVSTTQGSLSSTESKLMATPLTFIPSLQEVANYWYTTSGISWVKSEIAAPYKVGKMKPKKEEEHFRYMAVLISMGTYI